MEKQVYITEEEQAKCKKVAEEFSELYEMVGYCSFSEPISTDFWLLVP